MPPQTARSLMKDFRNSFRRKKDTTPKVDPAKQLEDEVQAKLLELKECIGDKLSSTYVDEDLIGFLRAKSMNVKETEKLVKLDESVKRILSVENYHAPPEIYPYNFSGVIGFDKEGSLVRVMNIGECDAKGIVHSLSTIKISKILLKMVNFDIALQVEENKKTGRNVKQMVYILNVENLSMYQISCKPAFDTMMQALKLFQDHYHDLLKAIYIVYAPPFFSSVFKLFKPVIQDFLQDIIRILDSGNSREELLKVIDGDVLPKYLGGNRLDSNGDPNCSEFIPFGFVVPESSYSSNFLDPNDPEVTTVTIAAGAKVSYSFPCSEVGSVVKWHIQSKDNDLGVGVFLEPCQPGNETPITPKEREEDVSAFEALTPIIRCQCHISPEEDSTVTWFTGNIIILFDNSYSWMNPKEVMFKITIIPPSESAKNDAKGVNQAAELINKIYLSC